MPTRHTAFVLLLLCFGCGRAPDVSTDPTGQASSNRSASAGAPAGLDADSTARLLDELTQAVRKYGIEQQRVPQNLDELVAQGYLPQVPQAPTGKRFTIDKKLQVHLANQ